jgi:hypothetical protein
MFDLPHSTWQAAHCSGREENHKIEAAAVAAAPTPELHDQRHKQKALKEAERSRELELARRREGEERRLELCEKEECRRQVEKEKALELVSENERRCQVEEQWRRQQAPQGGVRNGSAAVSAATAATNTLTAATPAVVIAPTEPPRLNNSCQIHRCKSERASGWSQVVAEPKAIKGGKNHTEQRGGRPSSRRTGSTSSLVPDRTKCCRPSHHPQQQHRPSPNPQP